MTRSSDQTDDDRPQPGDLTLLLQAADQGDGAVLEAVFERVYDELSRLARQVRRGRAGNTFNTTALVHEAYLKLVPAGDPSWENRRHFFGAAARAMRHILIDAARAQLADKRGGAEVAFTFDESLHAAPVRPDDLIALDEALDRLREVDARRAEIVLLRFFGGLTAEEAAQTLNTSLSTVERDWRAARAWLSVELGRGS